jgi:hypothetical protein
MERQKLVKVMTLSMAFVMMSPTLITGLTTVFQQSQPPANSAAVPISQDAQFAAQENGYLAVLQKETNNSTARNGLVAIAQSYAADRNLPKAIEIYQKLIKAAPQSSQVPSHQQRIVELQKELSTPPVSSPSSKP